MITWYKFGERDKAMQWYLHNLTHEQFQAINKAIRSVQKYGIDGNTVIVAAYRAYNRMMADTVPAGDMK